MQKCKTVFVKCPQIGSNFLFRDKNVDIFGVLFTIMIIFPLLLDMLPYNLDLELLQKRD